MTGRVLLPLSLAACIAGASGCRMQAETVKDDDPAAGSGAPGNTTGNVKVRSLHPPAQGDVAPIVRAEYDRAQADKRQLVVYLGATWCEPCQRFHRAVEHGDLDADFPGLTLLEFDADKDGPRLRAAGYSSAYIPLFALPNPDGRASGKQVEGGIKGDGAVRYVSDKLKGLLAQR